MRFINNMTSSLTNHKWASWWSSLPEPCIYSYFLMFRWNGENASRRREKTIAWWAGAVTEKCHWSTVCSTSYDGCNASHPRTSNCTPSSGIYCCQVSLVHILVLRSADAVHCSASSGILVRYLECFISASELACSFCMCWISSQREKEERTVGVILYNMILNDMMPLKNHRNLLHSQKKIQKWWKAETINNKSTK